MNALRFFKTGLFQNSLTKIRILYNNKIKSLEIPEKWKGGRLERLGLYWRDLFLDYKGVASDVIQDSKEKPRKALAISTGIFLILAAIKTNPDERAFHDQLVDNAKELMMVGHPVRNPISENHLRLLSICENQGVIRRLNLIFFSLIWVDDYDYDCKLYAAQCSYLRPKYLTFYERIIDFGLYGKWWHLHWKMKDFDINEDEWQI